jgi:hypothetical protein
MNSLTLKTLTGSASLVLLRKGRRRERMEANGNRGRGLYATVGGRTRRCSKVRIRLDSIDSRSATVPTEPTGAGTMTLMTLRGIPASVGFPAGNAYACLGQGLNSIALTNPGWGIVNNTACAYSSSNLQHVRNFRCIRSATSANSITADYLPAFTHILRNTAKDRSFRSCNIRLATVSSLLCSNERIASEWLLPNEEDPLCAFVQREGHYHAEYALQVGR